MQAALRVEHILAPGLGETDRHIVASRGEGALTGRGKTPGPQEARPARDVEATILQGLGQCRFFPAACVKVNGVTIREEPPREVGDIGLAASAGWIDILVA